jgi:hypothetical protein
MRRITRVSLHNRNFNHKLKGQSNWSLGPSPLHYGGTGPLKWPNVVLNRQSGHSVALSRQVGHFFTAPPAILANYGMELPKGPKALLNRHSGQIYSLHLWAHLLNAQGPGPLQGYSPYKSTAAPW